MASGFTTKLLSLTFVVAGVTAAQSPSPDYTVVKEVLGKDGSSPTWTVISSDHPRLKYTLQFSNECDPKDREEYDCDHPLTVGQTFGNYDIPSTGEAKGTTVGVDSAEFLHERWGLFTITEVKGDGGHRSVTHFYKILRVEAEKGASVKAAAQSVPPTESKGFDFGFGKPAQSASPRKDIPAIAEAANGAIVSIIMSDKDGKPIAQGSGFLVSKDGVIVTNYHVISEGSSAIVKLPGGAFFVVDGVLESDKARDVAIIRAHGDNFRTLTLGNSDRVQVGEEVVAIGNPLSLESTVSNGIVSAIRTIEDEGGKFLQVTAPISPGSSGGPLFDMAGEVVGITTLKFKGGENLNFAIPINDAKLLLKADSSKLRVFPNESESVKHDENASPSAPKTANTPDLKTTVEFMGRIVEPEHRIVLLGQLQGAVLHSRTSRSLSIVSSHEMLMALPTGETRKNGYPELTYSFISDGDGKHDQKDYPRYTSFSLGDIDPSSIVSKEGGYDPYVLSEFWDKHPRCQANPECSDEYLRFLDSAPKLTVVQFHTTDLKPLIERGGCTPDTGDCALSETAKSVLIFFKDKDRAERFITALIYAVKMEGGKPDLFPPTR